VQLAGTAALQKDAAERAEVMDKFREKVVLLTEGLNAIDGFHSLPPTATFYVFPNVAGVCERLGVLRAYEDLPPAARRKTSPAGMLQMFLLYRYGVATMDRNSFGRLGADGQHYLRLSIAASRERLRAGVAKIAAAATDAAGFRRFLDEERLWD